MQDTKVGLESKVAQFVSGLTYDDLPPQIAEDAKYRVLDWLGCALAGIRTNPSRIAAAMVKRTGGKNQATLLREGIKIPISQAAWANGITGHVVEFDDGHRKAIAHPGAVTVPTALAIAESFKRSGKELIAAVVAGYELLIRLGIAVNPSHYKVWHTTSTCGGFAAAATASSLLRLDKRRTQMALGIAGTMASGLQATFGTYAKPLNIGHACQSGVQASLLACEDFTGPEDILMGEKGFIAATSSDREITLLDQITAKRFLSDTAFYKMYSSCGHSHSPLDAIFGILQEHNLSPQTIKSVKIETYRTAVELTGRLKNSSEEEAKFSLPYCIACALLYQKVTLEEFTPEKLQDPVIIDLASKVQVIEDPEATKAFPKRHALVKVELSDGQVIQKKVTSSNDTAQYDLIERKFLSLAVPGVEYAAALQIKETVMRIDQLDDVNVLMRYLI